MKRPTTPSFILTLPMRHGPWQTKYIDKIFRAARNIYNNLVSNRKKALAQMERTREWKKLQGEIAGAFAAKQAELTGDKKKDAKIKEKYEAILAPLYKAKKELFVRYGFTEFAFQARVQKWRGYYKSLIGTHVAQKLAAAVWKKFERYFYGNGKRSDSANG